MINLQIGENDLIGGKFNGHDLHLYLNKLGIDSSHLIAADKDSDDDKTFIIDPKFRWIMRDADKHYNLVAGTHTLPFDIMYNKLFLKSDVIHLHLINNYMFNVNLLPLFTSLKPTVWTLHDPWALSGRCIHHFDCDRWKIGCGDCPTFSDTHYKFTQDTTAFNWEMKRIAFQNSQLTLIVASKWMQNLVKQSPFFKHCEVNLVPFGINQEIFKPESAEKVRVELGIDQDSVVIMCRMQDCDFKGGEIIKEMLRKFKSDKKITIITVSKEGLLSEFEGKFILKEYGWVKDDKFLAKLYQACDIFLMPSKVESFGMMAIEAMSCKKPVVVLEGTALPDTVNAPEVGIKCARNADALLKVTKDLVNDVDFRNNRAELSYQYALKEYGLDNYVKKIIKVYDSAIKSHKPSQYRDHVVTQLLKHDNISKIKKIDQDLLEAKVDLANTDLTNTNTDFKIENIMEQKVTHYRKEQLNFFGFIKLIELKQTKELFSVKVFSLSLVKIKTRYNAQEHCTTKKYYLFGAMLFKTKKIK